MEARAAGPLFEQVVVRAYPAAVEAAAPVPVSASATMRSIEARECQKAAWGSAGFVDFARRAAVQFLTKKPALSKDKSLVS